MTSKSQIDSKKVDEILVGIKNHYLKPVVMVPMGYSAIEEAKKQLYELMVGSLPDEQKIENSLIPDYQTGWNSARESMLIILKEMFGGT